MKCCEQYAAALSAFVDGELSENERDEVLAHVEHCRNCREYLSELMIVHTMFEEMPELDAPEGFSERVLARVHEEKRAKMRHRRAWPRVLAACFALLVITAAAWKLMPAMVSSGDSAADCASNGNDTVGAPTVSLPFEAQSAALSPLLTIAGMSFHAAAVMTSSAKHAASTRGHARRWRIFARFSSCTRASTRSEKPSGASSSGISSNIVCTIISSERYSRQFRQCSTWASTSSRSFSLNSPSTKAESAAAYCSQHFIWRSSPLDYIL